MTTERTFYFSAMLLPVLAACAANAVSDVQQKAEVQPVPGAEQQYSLFLPNGDSISYSVLPSGRAALTVDGAPQSREWPAVFQTEESGDEFWLIPGALRGYVNSGRLDREFFNIPALAALESLPVILVFGNGMDAREMERIAGELPGSRAVHVQPESAAVAVEIEAGRAGQFWNAVMPETRDGQFNHGIVRILKNANSRRDSAILDSAQETLTDCHLQGMHELTVEGIRRDGRPAAGAASLSSFQVLNVDDAGIHSSSEFFTNGEGRVCVPTGRYSIFGLVNTYDPDLEDIGIFFALEWVLVGNPEVEIGADTNVLLDAGEANEITFGTTEASERIDNFFRLQWRREAVVGGGLSGGLAGIVNLDNHPVGALRRFAAETAPVNFGELELVTDARLVEAGAGLASSVLYDLVVVRQNSIPSDLHYQADPDELAAVVNRLHGDLRPLHTLAETRHLWRPWQFTSVNTGREVQVTLERTEFLVGGDTRYQQRVDAAGQSAAAGPGRMDETETMYEVGERRSQTWFKPPLRPGIREFEPGATPVVRDGNTLILLMPEWVDAHPGHFGFRHTSVDTTAFRLYRDGDLIASVPRPRGQFPMAEELAEYRMELDISRNAQWQATSIQNRTVWTFFSQPGGNAEVQVLPLMLLDYDVELELGNDTAVNAAHLDVTARRQAGADGSPVSRVSLRISRDDGSTWERRTGHPLGNGRFRFPMEDVHAIGGTVSLRVEARDEGGSSIEQEIIRAYAVPEQIPPPCPPNCPEM